MNADRRVVDANVVAKWFLSEPHDAEARSLKEWPGQLLAPFLLVSEACSIFLKKIRAREMLLTDASAALASLHWSLSFLDAANLAFPALVIAERHGRSAYDALYVALAVEEDCQLVTADRRLYNALQPHYPATMLWIGDL